MNKKGQVLFLMVIIMPITLLFLGGTVELGLVSYNKIKLQNVTKGIINACYPDCNNELLTKSFKDNNLIVKEFKYDNVSGQIELKALSPSFLGSVIGKDNYDIKLKVSAKK